MKQFYLFIAFVCFFQSIALSQSVASITLNFGAEKKFTFSSAFPTLVTATQITSGNERYTDVDFSNLFEKEHEYVKVHIRFQPSGKGTFIVPSENNQPPNVFHIDVVYQKQTPDGDIQKQIVLDTSVEDGSAGTAVITQYGTVGTDVIGSFEANVRELKDGGGKGGLFKVSGSFKIKLGKE